MKIYTENSFNHLPDCILFDLDNTFYSYDPTHQAAIKKVQKKVTANFSVSEKDFKNAFEDSRRQIKDALGNTASSHSRLLYFQRMFEILGLGSQVLAALDLEQSYWSTFLSEIQLFDNAKEFLDDIRLIGIPSVLVTDLTAQIQFRKLIFLELDHYFDYIVTSEEAGCDKPNPKIFDLALQKIKPQGSNFWMIGDSLIKDLEGAKNSINAISIQKIDQNSINENKSITPDASFNHFSELRKLINQLIK